MNWRIDIESFFNENWIDTIIITYNKNKYLGEDKNNRKKWRIIQLNHHKNQNSK